MQDGIPAVHILARRVSSGSTEFNQYWWSVTIKAPDATGGRKLGYRATGFIVEQIGKSDFRFEQEPQVHDERRPVWTAMNPTDRPDIRKKITQLARDGVDRLKKSGEDLFEHRVP